MLSEVLIKNEYVKKYILENKKAPTQQQIKGHLNSFVEENPNVSENGLTAGTKINFANRAGKESSASNYNSLIERAINEQELIKDYYTEKVESLENNFRTFKNIFNRMFLKLRQTERNLNKQLILHEKKDIFSYGIVEDFSSYEKVDFENSNVYFMSGKVTLGFKKVATESILDSEIGYSVLNRNDTQVIQEPLNSFTNTLKEDGSFFKLIAKSRNRNDAIDFVIRINLNKPKSVDTLKFVLDAVETSSKLAYICMVSTDGANYNQVFESELRIQNGANYVEINQDNVKHIKLVISKTSYDYQEGDLYAYMFSLDYIGLTKKSFKINKKSSLFLGPYKIVDENNLPVNYNFATIRYGTCCLVPNKTAIKFFLSKDNVTWIPTSYTGQGREVIQFSESEADINTLFETVDVLNDNQIIKTNSLFNLKSDEAILNYKISDANLDNIILNTLNIKRNILEKNNNYINKSYSGWERDGEYFTTTLNISDPEGKFINFGNSSLHINDRRVTGKVFLTFGSHKIKTNKRNYFSILNTSSKINEVEILNARELKSIDSLYPFNHKYLIEGFKYNNDFHGKKVYKTVGDIYGRELIRVSNERFEAEKDINFFTIVKYNGFNYFKIKINSNFGDSKLEKVKLECNKKSTVNSNFLYIKAIIESSDPRVTPKIDQIQVRVI